MAPIRPRFNWGPRTYRWLKCSCAERNTLWSDNINEVSGTIQAGMVSCTPAAKISPGISRGPFMAFPREKGELVVRSASTRIIHPFLIINAVRVLLVLFNAKRVDDPMHNHRM